MFVQKANPYHDPKTGRFTHGPASARSAASEAAGYGSAYTPARVSILNEDGSLNIDAARGFAAEWLSDKPRVGKEHDTGLYQCRNIQGFNGKPHLVPREDFEKLHGSMLFRGDTRHEYSEEIKHGAFYPGTGLYGSGTYSTFDFDKAAAYSGQELGWKGGIITFKMHPSARIASGIGRTDETSGHMRSVSDALDEALDTGKISLKTHSILRGLTSDVGNTYAMLGYDAYHSANDFSDLIVLNRTAMVIADEPSFAEFSLSPSA